MKKKLIRDGYAHIIEQNEKTQLIVCPIGERKKMLIEKLYEEVGEFVNELDQLENKEDIPQVLFGRLCREYSDVHDVLAQIAHEYEIKYQNNDRGKFYNYVMLVEKE
jgi:predicted house-cleaning noncanonical NTP pyrophosphatase (MazG superfamily)